MKKEKMISANVLMLGFICLVASLGGLLFGFDTAVISGTISFVRDFYDLSDIQLGWFTGSALVGCVAGAVIAGKLGDKYGRKPVLIIAGVLFFLSAVGSAYPFNFLWLIIARILGGFGVGIASVIAPLYISEFAPARNRGRLVALYQFSIVTGIILAYLSNWWILMNSEEGAPYSCALLQDALVYSPWKGMFLIETIPAALFFLMMIFMPETPRWLILNEEIEKGRRVLNRIYAELEVKTIFQKIRLSHGDNKGGSIQELFRRGMLKAMLIGLALSVFGQLTGVNIVVYYGPSILENAGITLGGALQYQIGLGIINMFFTIISMFIIDRYGRRPLLIGGMAMVVIMLFTTSVFFMVGVSAKWIVIALAVYIGSIAISISAVIWVITPEIFPNRLRGRAVSIATFFNWSTNALVAMSFPWLITSLGMAAVFSGLGGICMIGLLLFYKIIPETKGKSLEEIENLFLS
jgi:SP family arabinose:H+ symporter-like MFS transporter